MALLGLLGRVARRPRSRVLPGRLVRLVPLARQERPDLPGLLDRPDRLALPALPGLPDRPARLGLRVRLGQTHLSSWGRCC